MQTIDEKLRRQHQRVEYQTLKDLIQRKQEIHINFSRSQAYHLLQLQLQSQPHGQVFVLEDKARPYTLRQTAQISPLNRMFTSQPHNSSPTLPAEGLLEVIKRQGSRLVSAGWGVEKPLMRSSPMSRTYRRKRPSGRSFCSEIGKQASEADGTSRRFRTVELKSTKPQERENNFFGTIDSQKGGHLKNNFSSHLPIKHSLPVFQLLSCQPLEVSDKYFSGQSGPLSQKEGSFIQQQPAPYTSHRKRKSLNQAVSIPAEKPFEMIELKKAESSCRPWSSHKEKQLKDQEEHPEP